MSKTGKRMQEALKIYSKEKSYGVDDAVGILKKISKAKFDESIDLSIKVNLKKGQSLRDTMVLPHQTSSDKKILVFAQGDEADVAAQAGATYVGGAEFIEKIKGGWLDFDVVIATPDMMKEVGKLGPVLGRRGLMPNPKTKTVTKDVAGAIGELQKGRIEIRADKTGVVHVSVGKSSMTESQIAENITAIINEVKIKKPSDTKGDFMLSVFISSTMSPSVRMSATV